MKPLHTLKWLMLLSTSAALTLTTATAEPGKEKKDKPGKPEHAENKPNKDFDKAERKAAKADEKSEKKMDKVEAREERREARRAYKKGEFKERFHDADRDRIVTYFAAHKGSDNGLPPGLAKRWKEGKRLPAGWRDRVVTGYVIEDEWYSAFEPVPYDWFPNIAVIPDTRLYWYGDRVVRVYEPTREVVDVVIIPTIRIDL